MSAWPVRLAQLQLSVVYVATVWHKVGGYTWLSGRAGMRLFRHEDMFRFVDHVPLWLADSMPLSQLVSWGTLSVELFVALAIWHPRLRRWAVAAGVLLHLSIDLLMVVGFFAPVMGLLYLAFTPPQVAARLLGPLRIPARRPAQPRDDGAGSSRPLPTPSDGPAPTI